MGHDLVIRGGTVVDGTGAPSVRADVAIDGDRIVSVGDVDASGAAEVIEADGRLVTPGFVDLHSHLDAQIGWDPLMSSSCWHGVTSVVMGNCGMTFAPVRPGQAEVLAHAMESVEDIPASAILEGLSWDWESYGQYLDAIDRVPILDLSSGYLARAADRLPKSGDTYPWQVYQSYVKDYRATKRSEIRDDVMRFSRAAKGSNRSVTSKEVGA